MDIQIPVYRYTIRELRPGDRSSGSILRALRRLGLDKVRSLRRSEVFFVRGNIAPEELRLLGRFLFSDPVIQDYELAACPWQPQGGSQAVEVAFHPGVTDPVAEEILRSARELGVRGIDAAATAFRYELICSPGEKLGDSELRLAASRVLSNPVVQSFSLGSIEPSFPQKAAPSPEVLRIDVHTMDDTALLRLDEERRSALDPEELRSIRSYFASEGRSCTDVEYETLAQTWSEHCFHKTFKALVDVEGGEEFGLPPLVDNILKTYIKAATDEIAAPWVISAFKDNAGIVDFDGEHDISIKVETHNHPSAIEPFGGANTGVGGVIRDIMAVSARPIALTDLLCFGFPGGETPGGSPEGALSPEAMRSGIVAGVQDYGNKMGIPTVNGGIHYHAAYAANPLVYCGCAGISPRGAFRSAPRPGDRVVCLGGKTGRDGIRGATFSSMTMDDSTLGLAGSAVQIGDPIVEKKLSELILAARDAGLFTGITDCGAGGLSSAVGEMASELGADVELTRVGLKYPGLAPWEIWLSEAQERMVLAVDPAKMEELALLCGSLDVECFDLGAFTGRGRLVVRFSGEPVLDLDCGFLHEGAPRRRLKASPPPGARASADGMPDASASRDSACAAYPEAEPGSDRESPSRAELLSVFRAVLGHHAVNSRGWVARRYDHEVQGATITGPFAGSARKGPSDAAVLAPLDCSGKMGISLSNGFNPRYGESDPYRAAWSALDEAVRGAVASGADPDRIAVVDNFCWGDPKKPENMWSLLLAAKGCRDAALAHRSPFVSGKDSFNNEFVDEGGKRASVPPSLLISAMGVVPDVDRVCTTDLKKPGGFLYLVGDFRPEPEASVLQDILVRGRGKKWNYMPPREAPATYRILHKAMRAGLVESCHDLSEGGLGAALAEMCIGGGIGAGLSMEALRKAFEARGDGASDIADLHLLFGETDGCLICEIAPSRAMEFEAVLGAKAILVGETRESPEIVVSGRGNTIVLRLEELERAYGPDDEDPEERGNRL